MTDASWITVVSGLPRSGTSLMMQMLAAGGMPVLTDGARPADSDNPRGYLECEAVKAAKRDAAWTETAGGKAVKVVYALLRGLPARHDYRVISMHRPLDEVVASQRAMLRRLGREGARVPDCALAERFEIELAQAEAWVRQQPGFRLLQVSYHDCLDHALATATAVSRFLDNVPNPLTMASAVDPDLYRQRLRGCESGSRP